MRSFAQEILFGTPEGVEQYLQAGVDLEEIDEYGFSPLIETAIANRADLTALFLGYGVDVNKPDATGRSALHWAVDNENMALCRLLLDHKADANAYTTAGQPLLVYPLLRGQHALKKLLYQYGAKLVFAQDFIYAKLLGHRYTLAGQVDIVNAEGHFLEIDYEGFFLEFTLAVITHSLQRYQNNFSARPLRAYFNHLQRIIQALLTAQALLKYQRYLINVEKYSGSIESLLDQELLLLPVAYEGHAIAFIKYGQWLVHCDRGEHSRKVGGGIVVYRLQNPAAWTPSFCKQLIFAPQTRKFITETIQRVLGLTPVTIVPIAPQTQGTCSWSNIEAVIPAVLLVLELRSGVPSHDLDSLQDNALRFYEAWRQWDQDRALEEFIKGFQYGSKPRQVFKATLLAAILFQRCTWLDARSQKKAQRILKILMLPDFRYLLRSYLQVYWKSHQTEQGKVFVELLNACGINAAALL